MKRACIVVIAACSLGPAITQAEDMAPRVTERQQRQQAQIRQGVASGQLTPQEAEALQDQQRAIIARRRNLEADGKLTKQERKLLRYEQQSARNALRSKKADR